MKRVNALLAAAGVALVLVSAWATVMFVSFRSEKERAQALESQVVQLQRQLDAAGGREKVLVAGISSRTTQAPSPPAAPSPAAPRKAASPEREAQESEQDRWRRRMADPKYRAAMLAQRRYEIEGRLPDIAKIGFAPGVLARLLDLLAEQELRENEAMLPGSEARTVEDARKQQLEMQARAQRDEEERRALLGESDYARWREYMDTGQARAQLRDLRVQLSSTRSPLRAEQFDSLVKSLTAEHQRHHGERRAHYAASQDTQPAAIQVYMERRFALIEETIDRQRELGRTYLDSEQMELFNRMLDRQLEGARVELRSWAVFNKAEMREPR